MMKITGLSHLFKWENLHNWWLTKYFFAPLYIHIYIYIYIHMILKPKEIFFIKVKIQPRPPKRPNLNMPPQHISDGSCLITERQTIYYFI